MRWLDSIIHLMDMNLGKLRETVWPGVLRSMEVTESDTTEQLNNSKKECRVDTTYDVDEP